MRNVWKSCRLAVVAIALASAAGAQTPAQTPADPERGSFFEALGPVLDSLEVFAVDAGSLAQTLSDGFGWGLSSAEVESSLGPEFLYGGSVRFLVCEPPAPCWLARDGAHAEAVGGRLAENPFGIDLRIALRYNVDRAVFERSPVISLRQFEDGWRVVSADAQLGSPYAPTTVRPGPPDLPPGFEPHEPGSFVLGAFIGGALTYLWAEQDPATRGPAVALLPLGALIGGILTWTIGIG